jgi:hypothetical protein
MKIISVYINVKQKCLKMKAKYMQLKWTVLILLSLAFFHSEKAAAQTGDSAAFGKPFNATQEVAVGKKTYKYLQIRTGILGGYQFFAKDSANITIAIPVSINYRIFPDGSPSNYFDFELMADNIVLNRNELINFTGISLGSGFLSKLYNSNMQGHVGYLHGSVGNRSDLVVYKNILFAGYIFETSSIPLVFDIYVPIRKGFVYNAFLLLVGVKIPMATFDLTRNRAITLN